MRHILHKVHCSLAKMHVIGLRACYHSPNETYAWAIIALLTLVRQPISKIFFLFWIRISPVPLICLPFCRHVNWQRVKITNAVQDISDVLCLFNSAITSHPKLPWIILRAKWTHVILAWGRNERMWYWSIHTVRYRLYCTVLIHGCARARIQYVHRRVRDGYTTAVTILQSSQLSFDFEFLWIPFEGYQDDQQDPQIPMMLPWRQTAVRWVHNIRL